MNKGGDILYGIGRKAVGMMFHERELHTIKSDETLPVFGIYCIFAAKSEYYGKEV